MKIIVWENQAHDILPLRVEYYENSNIFVIVTSTTTNLVKDSGLDNLNFMLLVNDIFINHDSANGVNWLLYIQKNCILSPRFVTWIDNTQKSSRSNQEQQIPWSYSRDKFVYILHRRNFMLGSKRAVTPQ